MHRGKGRASGSEAASLRSPHMQHGKRSGVWACTHAHLQRILDQACGLVEQLRAAAIRAVATLSLQGRGSAA